MGTVDESRARSQSYATSYHTEYTGVQDTFNQSSKLSQSSQSSYESRHESQSRGGPQAKRGRPGNVRLTPAGSAKSNHVGIQGPYGNPNHKNSSSHKNSAKKSYGLAEQSKGPKNLYKNPQKSSNSEPTRPLCDLPPMPATLPPDFLSRPPPSHLPPPNQHPHQPTHPLPRSPFQNLRSNRHPTPQKCRCPKLECPSLWPKSK